MEIIIDDITHISSYIVQKLATYYKIESNHIEAAIICICNGENGIFLLSKYYNEMVALFNQIFTEKKANKIGQLFLKFMETEEVHLFNTK